jgi:hypothetical protein
LPPSTGLNRYLQRRETDKDKNHVDNENPTTNTTHAMFPNEQAVINFNVLKHKIGTCRPTKFLKLIEHFNVTVLNKILRKFMCRLATAVAHRDNTDPGILSHVSGVLGRGMTH